jgi:outer membrane protein OmpA-like peptidoglycan-associated protein
MRSRGAVPGVAFLSLAAATLTLIFAMTTNPAEASLPAVDTPSVPILGQVVLKQSTETGRASAVGTLHGVRRIPGGTVIYYSMGFPSSTQQESHLMTSLAERSPAFSRSAAYTPFAKNMLVDPAGKKAYTGLFPSGDTAFQNGKHDCICSETASSTLDKLGQANVFYQVVAPLPASVAFVDVFISGQIIGHVKVEDGAMTPAVEPGKPILVGMGWPKIDQAVVASSVEPSKSIIDLKSSVADLEGMVTTRTTPKQISVALASDVLFATDSATLSPRSQAVLRQAAADVKAAGGAGSLQVMGYTDDTGSTSHNVDLSARRAASVAAAIKPLLPAGVTLPTSGKGEADPVAPNTTVEGRALNRRVSIVFAPQGGAK